MKNLMILCLCLISASCTTLPDDNPPSNFTFGGGAYILNEGNFNSGNGSLSFYSYDSSKVFNDLFYKANGRPLGDVPNYIISSGGKLYIVVNNSGKIEVVDQNTHGSLATIKGLISPRNIAVINDNKAYVTSIYSDSVTIINLFSNSISGYIKIGHSSEAIAVAGNSVYVSNWMNGNKVMVIDAMTDRLTDSIDVGTEPESMVVDYAHRLWVLCTGGWKKEHKAELDVINTLTNDVLKKYEFPSLENSPSCLKTDDFGLTLYYIDNGVRKMDVNSSSLPPAPFILQSNAYFYKIAVNPINSDILVTDAGDFTNKGNVLLYKNDGTLVSKNTADIIPGEMCFRLTINPNK
jgi:YVTN family beta-propeller protein